MKERHLQSFWLTFFRRGLAALLLGESVAVGASKKILITGYIDGAYTDRLAPWVASQVEGQNVTYKIIPPEEVNEAFDLVILSVPLDGTVEKYYTPLRERTDLEESAFNAHLYMLCVASSEDDERNRIQADVASFQQRHKAPAPEKKGMLSRFSKKTKEQVIPFEFIARAQEGASNENAKARSTPLGRLFQVPQRFLKKASDLSIAEHLQKLETTLTFRDPIEPTDEPRKGSTENEDETSSDKPEQKGAPEEKDASDKPEQKEDEEDKAMLKGFLAFITLLIFILIFLEWLESDEPLGKKPAEKSPPQQGTPQADEQSLENEEKENEDEDEEIL